MIQASGFIVDLKATLTADAEVVEVPNTNSVKIEFSNVPGTDYVGDDFTDDDPKGTTSEIEVKTYTTSLTITKLMKLAIFCKVLSSS